MSDIPPEEHPSEDHPVAHPRTRAGFTITPRAIVYSLCTFVTGCGIGWFLGLSLQALGGAVLGPIVGVITGAASILAGVGVTTEGNDGATRADPILVMLLIVGLVGGSALSTYARANLWPRPDAKFISKTFDIPLSDVNRRVFEGLYPPPPCPCTVAPAPVLPRVDCARLTAIKDTSELVKELRKVNDPDINKLLDQPVRSKLDLAVVKLCGK